MPPDHPAADADPDLANALSRCANGEAAALQAIYDRMAPQMLGVALRILRRRALAEDVLHETFLKIWTGAGSFDPARGAARSWIFAILRHQALNALRSEARMEAYDDAATAEIPADDPDPEAVVEALSEASALRRCLAGLEPLRRQAIVLAYTRGLTHGELAGRLGQPLGTVKSWIRRGLAALKACMA